MKGVTKRKMSAADESQLRGVMYRSIRGCEVTPAELQWCERMLRLDKKRYVAVHAEERALATREQNPLAQ